MVAWKKSWIWKVDRHQFKSQFYHFFIVWIYGPLQYVLGGDPNISPFHPSSPYLKQEFIVWELIKLYGLTMD